MTRLRILAAAAALSLLATNASAAIMSATYTGAFNYQSKSTDLFGLAGGSAVGQAFELTFVYDTALGQLNTFPAGSFLRGGSAYGADQFMLSSKLSFNNATTELTAPMWLGQVELVPDYQLQAPSNHATGGACHDAEKPVASQPYFYACLNTLDPVPGDFEAEFTALADPLSNSLAVLIFTDGLVFQGRPDKLVVTKLRESPTEVGGVPEPATWALMILGFGAAGAALRRVPGRVKAA